MCGREIQKAIPQSKVLSVEVAAAAARQASADSCRKQTAAHHGEVAVSASAAGIQLSQPGTVLALPKPTMAAGNKSAAREWAAGVSESERTAESQRVSDSQRSGYREERKKRSASNRVHSLLQQQAGGEEQEEQEEPGHAEGERLRVEAAAIDALVVGSVTDQAASAAAVLSRADAGPVAHAVACAMLGHLAHGSAEHGGPGQRERERQAVVAAGGLRAMLANGDTAINSLAPALHSN